MIPKAYPVGIGTDIASVCEIERLCNDTKGAFVEKTFTEREKSEADTAKPYSYYGKRFAAKEAVFKAVAPLLGDEKFDFRIVETLKRPDGSPYININEKLRAVMDRAGVSDIMISLSEDGGFALAFAVAVRYEGE